MENKFDYWVKNDVGKFIGLYWMQYCLFYVLGAWLALHSRTLSAFFIIGFLPYLVILIYRWSHNPFNDVESGIKKYNSPLHERLSKLVSEKQPKQRAIPPFFKGSRGDLAEAFANPPKSPFRKGGLWATLTEFQISGASANLCN